MIQEITYYEYYDNWGCCSRFEIFVEDKIYDKLPLNEGGFPSCYIRLNNLSESDFITHKYFKEYNKKLVELLYFACQDYEKIRLVPKSELKLVKSDFVVELKLKYCYEDINNDR